MKSSNVPRLRRIRLTMLLCILVLAGFLGYWLRNEYGHEKEVLRKDFSDILLQVNTRLDDSIMVKHFVEPVQASIQLGGDSAKTPSAGTTSRTGTFSYSISTGTPRPVNVRMMMLRDSNSRAKGDSSGIAKHRTVFRRQAIDVRSQDISADSLSEHLRRQAGIDTLRPDSVGSMLVYANETDSLTYLDAKVEERVTRGIRLLIENLAELPGNLSREFNSADSESVRLAFQQAAMRSGLQGNLHWVQDSSGRENGGLLLDRDILHDRKAAVTGYESQLISRTAPQILFSSFLLCLTGLAFGMTYRALRSQMELATIRNDFISNMSHELKTPVSTVKVALEAISEPAVLDNRALTGEYLHMAGLEMSRLELLINQALQSALLEGGRLRMEQEPVNLRTLTDQMCRIMQGRFAQQNGSLSTSFEGSEFAIAGDALHLQGVLVNILDNALKYAGPEPEVGLHLSASGNRIRIQIDDRGPGIPAHYRKKVFEKFFRIPRGNEHSVKGYGLGLNYAAEVMRSHGGLIELKDNPGGGASFVLSFPTYRA